MQKDDSQANLPIKSPLASPLDEILKRLGRMQNDLVNQVSGQAGYTVEEKFADAVPAKMSLQYVRGRDLIQNSLPEHKLSPADLKAIEVYRRIHNELPAKLPFYNKDTLSRDIDILVSGKARAVQNAQQVRQALKAEKATIAQGKIDHSHNRPVERSNTDKAASDKPALQKSQGSKPWQAPQDRSIEKPPATAPLLQKISFIREMRRICDTASASSSEMHVRPRGNLDTPVVISRLVQSLYRANIERHPAREHLARIFKDKDIDRFISKYDGFAVLRLVPRLLSKQDKVHPDIDRRKPILIVARLKGDYQNPLWHVAHSERFERSLSPSRAPRAIPISMSHTVKCFTSGAVTLQRYFGQPRAEKMRLMMSVADLFHRTQTPKTGPVKPNYREMPIYKSAMALRIFEAPAKIKAQMPQDRSRSGTKPHYKADNSPGQVSGADIRTGSRSRSISVANSSSAKGIEARFSQAAGDKISPNTAKQYFTAQCNRVKSDRYIGSADVTFVLVFALAVAAKNRLDVDETGSNLNIYQRLESQYTLSDGQATRPVLCVREGDTMDGIARELFNNASVAHLIADLNMAAIQEEYLEGKRIIRLKERQQLRLPLLEDINAYFAGKYHKIADKAELVTIVESSQIDDEAVYEHLARILSGADKNIKQLAQTIPGENTAKKDKEWFDSPAIYRKALIKTDLISTVAEDDNHFEIQDGDRIVDYKHKLKGNQD